MPTACPPAGRISVVTDFTVVPNTSSPTIRTNQSSGGSGEKMKHSTLVQQGEQPRDEPAAIPAHSIMAACQAVERESVQNHAGQFERKSGFKSALLLAREKSSARTSENVTGPALPPRSNLWEPQNEGRFDLIALIQRMWQANPTWGSPRIQAELAKLGIQIWDSTVRKYRLKHRRSSSQVSGAGLPRTACG